jgi:uncharacterized membrane protein YhaH (DUF805 family)
MTATTACAPHTDAVVQPAEHPVVWRTGLRSGLVAAAATTAVAAVASATDVPLEIGGEAIPLAGFSQLTLVFVAVGVLLARVLVRRARDAERTWVRTTVALTAASLVPDLVADATTATKAVLILTHLVAAAIVIPAIAARLRSQA